MQTPVRPTTNIMDDIGNITPPWNSYFTAFEAGVYRPAYGTTANRPTAALRIGEFYYDTTLGYPVWVHSLSPTVWHNAAGIPV
jgi:hypothetical protein